MSCAPVLELRRVRRSFGGIRAVDGVDLAIGDGSKVALIGPNGAGKSTLFGLISGEMTPSAGDILLDGSSVVREPPHLRTRRGFGRTFQVARVFGQLTVQENLQLAFIARLRRRDDLVRPSRRRYRDRVDALLREVHLSEQSDRLAARLAHAEKKRLELGLVLALEPRLLLLDEPTAGMGIEERAALIALVITSVEKRGLTLLFTEHDMDVVFARAERIVVMDHGQVVADGSGEEVRNDRNVQEIYLGRYGSEAVG